MTDHQIDVHTDVDIHTGEGASKPLVPEEPECESEGEYIYDESGSLLRSRSQPEAFVGPRVPGLIRPPILPPIELSRPCSRQTLDGSWYIQLTPKGDAALERQSLVHGAMRIESADERKLHVSGDVYAEAYDCRDGTPYKPVPKNPLSIRENWYPQFPMEKYSWYFRSRGAYYSSGRLLFKLERHSWDDTQDDFAGSETGWMDLECEVTLLRRSWLPRPSPAISGTARVGSVEYDVEAFKTSPYYRGCLIEVDVMEDRDWPATAPTAGGGTTTFNGVYRDAGFEFLAVVDEVDLPEDADLTLAEIQQLLSQHRNITPAGPYAWRLWSLVGSRMGGTLGIMFDDQAPFREGAASFHDPTLPSISSIDPTAQGSQIGDVPRAFLRTALHEIGHCFNLFHPKHDSHSVATGTTIMNQTGDVMGFSSASNPYPGSATFGFNEHNRTSLVHSPDPQVRPGWKRFGYGHGGIGNAPGVPSDATFDRDAPSVEGLGLSLELPDQVYPGELVIATLRVRNDGDESRDVTAALNLAEDYLQVHVTPPNGSPRQLRSVIVVCSDRRTVELEPGDAAVGHVQLLYTNQEHVFEMPGKYKLRAELDHGDRSLQSETITVQVRSPLSEAEADLSQRGLDDDVGRSIGRGYARPEDPAVPKLAELSEMATDTDIGTAAAIVLANSYSQDVRDIRRGDILRAADEEESAAYLDAAFTDRTAEQAIRVATAVAPPGEPESPVIDMMLDRIEETDYDDDDRERARALVADFRDQLQGGMTGA